MFYDNGTKNATKMYRVLSCVLYYFIDICFIDYICCQSSTIHDISSAKLFEDKSYNKLFGIGLTDVSINIISCHGFMKNTNLTVVLVCRSWLVNYYLEKGFIILEHNSKHSISVLNDAKQIIHDIDKQKTDYVMLCYTLMSFVENTLKKFHIQSNLYNFYKHNFYHNKRDKFDEHFDQYHLHLLKDIDHPALIQKQKQNIDAAAYENNLNR